MAIPSHATPLERAVHVGLRLFTGLVMAFLVVPIFVVFPLSFTSGQLLIFPPARLVPAVVRGLLHQRPVDRARC